MRAQCCICSDLFVGSDTIAATACGHVFHEHCLARWLLSSKTCPSCRKGVAQGAVIPKLFFDIAEEETGEEDPEKLSVELRTLRAEVGELRQKQSKHKAKKKELRDKLRQVEEELENVRLVLRQEQDTAAAQKRLLRQYEAQLQVHKEERSEFIRTQRKLTELKHVDALVSGSAKDCEEILQQYSCGDRGSFLQLAKYAAILKREYEQAKAEKKSFKEQLEKLRKSSYTSSRDLSELRADHKSLQEQMSRSEEDLKQAEKMVTSLKAKVSKLQYSRKHPGESSGSFLETPKGHNVSDNVFKETPKLSGMDSTDVFETPKMSRQAGSEVIDLDETGQLNQSFDLFEESPQTQVRKTCQENNMRVVKISSAATASRATKRAVTDTDEADTFPLSTLNIMKKRDKGGLLLGRTVIRKDYNGFGGTSSFIQPIGAPKFAAPRIGSKASKKIKLGKTARNPALPKMDMFIDLS